MNRESKEERGRKKIRRERNLLGGLTRWSQTTLTFTVQKKKTDRRGGEILRDQKPRGLQIRNYKEHHTPGNKIYWGKYPLDAHKTYNTGC